jgi:hypothetical protein
LDTLPGDSEIDQNHSTVFCEENIRRIEVSMGDTLLMELGESGEELIDDGAGEGLEYSRRKSKRDGRNGQQVWGERWAGEKMSEGERVVWEGKDCVRWTSAVRQEGDNLKSNKERHHRR